MMDHEEQIEMTPLGKTATSTTILVERRRVAASEKASRGAYVGGGQHSGIIVNKDSLIANGTANVAQLQLEFKVFLHNARTQMHSQESRQLRFWFKNILADPDDQARAAQDFFKDLVSPLEFPRDYVGFIKKIMKLMQHKYHNITKTEIELRQLSETEHLPQRPSEEDLNQYLTEEKLLQATESAYPNPILLKDIAKRWSCTEEEVEILFASLAAKGLVKALAKGIVTRVHQNETDVQVVRQMPTITSNKQPTIALITAQYCEKLAVDAMIENQETFVRYTTVGESNVYTLGNIGAHRVVCTKLPQVGHDRSAAIAAGNTTTRLLGTFQKVEHVVLVGVGGGVPHFTDYNKHVRLGDVVVAAPPDGQKYMYMYCDDATTGSDGSLRFETKSWAPSNLVLQNIATQLKDMGMSDRRTRPWLKYAHEAADILADQEMVFSHPSSETDQLYMNLGGGDLIQVSHPAPPAGQERRDGEPRIHIGAVAAGRSVAGVEERRQEFATRLGVRAFDKEFDAVVEAVVGSRKDQYAIVRGICDYKDGSTGRDWQPWAALCAAAFAKSIICALDPPSDDD